MAPSIIGSSLIGQRVIEPAFRYDIYIADPMGLEVIGGKSTIIKKSTNPQKVREELDKYEEGYKMAKQTLEEYDYETISEEADIPKHRVKRMAESIDSSLNTYLPKARNKLQEWEAQYS